VRVELPYEARKKRENLLRRLHRRIFFLNFFCYEVIVKQKKNERSRLYYSRNY